MITTDNDVSSFYHYLLSSMCPENFTYMLFQSIKAACNDEYVNPDIYNSTCMDDIGLVAEVRGLAHLVVSKQIYFIPFFFFNSKFLLLVRITY